MGCTRPGRAQGRARVIPAQDWQHCPASPAWSPPPKPPSPSQFVPNTSGDTLGFSTKERGARWEQDSVVGRPQAVLSTSQGCQKARAGPPFPKVRVSAGAPVTPSCSSREQSCHQRSVPQFPLSKTPRCARLHANRRWLEGGKGSKGQGSVWVLYSS